MQTLNLSHLAAPYRKILSPTVRYLIRYGLLDKSDSFLDFGCGRGFDFQELQKQGYNAQGFDPYYFPDCDLLGKFDVVSCNYVLNVVESIDERREVLRKAWELTNKRLIVAANCRGKGISEGEYSSIGCLKKEFNFVELRGFIQSTLGKFALPIGRDRFCIERDAFSYNPLPYNEVLIKIEDIKNQGWIAPDRCFIVGYQNGFAKKRYYRLQSEVPVFPGRSKLVRTLHLKGDEGVLEAKEAIRRRNRILEVKFNCVEQKFLEEFLGRCNFNFLDSERVKICWDKSQVTDLNI
jgi:SAM-dependent methyltransferase